MSPAWRLQLEQVMTWPRGTESGSARRPRTGLLCRHSSPGYASDPWALCQGETGGDGATEDVARQETYKRVRAPERDHHCQEAHARRWRRGWHGSRAMQVDGVRVAVRTPAQAGGHQRSRSLRALHGCTVRASEDDEGSDRGVESQPTLSEQHLRRGGLPAHAQSTDREDAIAAPRLGLHCKLSRRLAEAEPATPCGRRIERHTEQVASHES